MDKVQKYNGESLFIKTFVVSSFKIAYKTNKSGFVITVKVTFIKLIMQYKNVLTKFPVKNYYIGFHKSRTLCWIRAIYFAKILFSEIVEM